MPGKNLRDDVQITLGTARICNLLRYDIGNNQSDIRNLYVVQTLSELFPHAVSECSHHVHYYKVEVILFLCIS
mgnify:CR=1 FL=1